MEKRICKIFAMILALVIAVSGFAVSPATVAAAEETIVLRVSNWEEYIDLGDWGEDEVIDLESTEIFGEYSLVEDFQDWYYEQYGIRVVV